MTKDKGEPSKPNQGQGAGKKNAAALSAALRANLQRRKARERALRTNAQDRQDHSPSQSASDDGAAPTDEATWTE